MEKKIILVSHGELSAGMKNSVQMIVGEKKELTSYSMMPGEHYQTIVDDIERLVKDNQDTQFIVLADLLGGSVSNGVTDLVHYTNLKLIAGMNMGLVIEMLFAPTPITDEVIARKIETCCQGVVHILPDLINNESEEPIEDFFDEGEK